MIYEKVKVFPSNQRYYNKVVTKELISRKIFELDRVLQNAQCTLFWLHSVEITEIYCHQKIFRQIAYLVISLVKMLLSRNFCQKRVTANFRNFHTVLWTINKFFRQTKATSATFGSNFTLQKYFFWEKVLVPNHSKHLAIHVYYPKFSKFSHGTTFSRGKSRI